MSGRHVFLASLFVVVASARIAATYPVFSATWDEPLHIAAGVELLSRGTYTHDLQNAPLPRLAAAIGPYLTGAQSAGLAGPIAEGNAVIVSGAGYRRNLELARAGILPFFVLCCALLYSWTRLLGGDTAATAATAVFTLAPPVLAHAGLATTDAAGMAAFAGLLLAFTRWLEQTASLSRTIWLGVAGGFALSSKFSLISFFAVTALGMLVSRWAYARRSAPQNRYAFPKLPAGRMALAGVIALVVLFATYGFSVARVLGFPAPLSEFALGLLLLVRHNMDGGVAFLLGKTYVGGRRDFFPIVLGVKTPLPMLGLALGGGVLAARRWWQGEGAAWIDAPVAALATLLVACSANLNLGVRHILPMFPALALLAGCAFMTLWRRNSVSRALVSALSLWLVVGTWRAHPDYLAYFNELASHDPGAVLVDSDLDWGQDVERLADTVRARGIRDLSLSYFGTGDRVEQLLGTVTRVGVDSPRPTGWFAVSETYFRRGYESFDETGHRRIYPQALDWLRGYQPVARIGRSIRLYDLRPTQSKSPPAVTP